MICAPGDLARRGVERGEPAAHAQLAAGVSDQDLALDDERGHRDRLTLVDVAELRAPHLLSGVGVNGKRLTVERVEENLAVRVSRATVDEIAAGDALRRRVRLRLERPLRGRAGL